jgi:hypothetical protein
MLCSERRSQHLSLIDMEGCANLIIHAQLFHKYTVRENEEHPATLPVLRASHKAQKIRDMERSPWYFPTLSLKKNAFCIGLVSLCVCTCVCMYVCMYYVRTYTWRHSYIHIYVPQHTTNRITWHHKIFFVSDRIPFNIIMTVYRQKLLHRT